nr:hypothetical protein [Tanacetum cinerariifolium]
MDQRMNEAVKVAVQIQYDRLRDEAQKENDEFLKTVDENMQKIIKEQVKEQVKVQVSKILPRIEQTVNEQLEAKVLTRSSHSSKTSYAVAFDLSEMELKKILIEKMEGNKSIQRSDEQRNLYKALVEAYKSDTIILDTYEETVTLKRRRDDDADKDEEPSAGPDRGSKRRREGKEPESASDPTETAIRSAGRDDEKDDEEEGGDDEQEYNEEEFIHPSLSTHAEEEPRDEESFDPIPKTPEDTDDEGNDEEDLGLNVGIEEGHGEEEEEDELYRDVNINQRRGIQTTQEVEDSHVTLTPVNPDVCWSRLCHSRDRTSIYGSADNEAVQVAVQLQSDRLRKEAQKENDEFLKTINENMQKIIKEQFKEQVKVQVSKILPRIEQTVNEQLEAEVLTRSSNSSKTSYIVAADLSEMELKKILIEKMEGNKSIHRSNEQRNLYKALVEAYESDKIILDTYGDTVTLKRRRDDDADKDEEPSVGPDRGSKRHKEGKEPESASAPMETTTRCAGRSIQVSQSRQTLASESHPEWFSQQQKPPIPDRDLNKTLSATHRSIQPWISDLVKQSDSRSSFNELIDTLVDFSNFLINRLKVDTLTPELLAGLTYELLKGSCKSLVELEYHLEEVYKATTDQLDGVNPEGQQYPHNLLKPLPLIPNNRGCRIILFDHFINNDLEYLRGGASSCTYTTSITKTKAADYGHIKWIEDLFYDFAVNQESARDVYSKRRIIAVTKLKIVEWHNYKHLDWIMVRRDDYKLYKFKKGNFKRLRIQDIEDMLLLLVQGKLTNLIVEERFAFNISLRMFTRSIVIHRRVEDLQLVVESYQKKLNLATPDTYRSDLKRKEAYIAYSNPRGFIYQNKDKKKRLMRIDELHKFSDGTLIDVRTALDDHLRSFERFVGGRLYEGDFMMLQRTI